MVIDRLAGGASSSRARRRVRPRHPLLSLHDGHLAVELVQGALVLLRFETQLGHTLICTCHQLFRVPLELGEAFLSSLDRCPQSGVHCLYGLAEVCA